MSDSPRIRIRGLAKAFGGARVLDGVDLDVAVGESLAVIGQSGTGKSVMIKCVLGLIDPDAGSIEVDGEEMAGAGPAARDRLRAKFGMLFQGGALFDSLRVWENVAFSLIQGRGMERVKAREIAFEKLAAVGLGAEVGQLRPAELSGGMQKRVALARAIAAQPDLPPCAADGLVRGERAVVDRGGLSEVRLRGAPEGAPLAAAAVDAVAARASVAALAAERLVVVERAFADVDVGADELEDAAALAGAGLGGAVAGRVGPLPRPPDDRCPTRPRSHTATRSPEHATRLTTG